MLTKEQDGRFKLLENWPYLTNQDMGFNKIVSDQTPTLNVHFEALAHPQFIITFPPVPARRSVTPSICCVRISPPKQQTAVRVLKS